MRKRTIVAALSLLAFAQSAAAAEGGLEIFPDLVEIVQTGASPLGSRFVQLVVLFLLLIWPVNRLVITPLLHVLDERSARIEGTRKRAGEVGASADAALARYSAAVEEARKQAGELRKSALETARSDQVRILADARRAAEAEVAAARSGVAGALGKARATLRSETEALAREAAARVLGRPLS
jgi:F-type H+-transporting ATPase subunit b